MAIIYENEGNKKKGLEWYKKSWKIYNEKLGESHPDTIDALK